MASSATNRLRQIAKQREEALLRKAGRVREHLERFPKDLQSARFVLHELLVEAHDIHRNLERDPEWVPKPKRGKVKKVRAISDVPAPPEREVVHEPRKESKYRLKPPVPPEIPPEDYRKAVKRGEGRDWCSAPFVEVALPVNPQLVEQLIAHLSKFRSNLAEEVVRAWAVETYGSVAAAKEKLRERAELPEDEELWRAALDGFQTIKPVSDLKWEELRAEPAARTWVVRKLSREYEQRVAKEIGEFAGKKFERVNKDQLAKRLSSLKAFFTSVNSGKHTNPQFPYLSDESDPLSRRNAGVYAADGIQEYLALPEIERYGNDPENPKRPRLRGLQKELGAVMRPFMHRGQERPKRWRGTVLLEGTMTRRREGALLWDDVNHALVLVVPCGGQPGFAQDNFRYFDGRALDSQLLTTRGCGQSSFVLPLLPKHDFLRWYDRHVQNHDANARPEFRCDHSTTQFVLLNEGTETKPKYRMFIRPVLKFLDPKYEVKGTHDMFSLPECRYLIGIDRGINYPLRAVAVDLQEKAVVWEYSLPGKVDEWRQLRGQIAYHQSQRARLRNERGAKDKIERHSVALAALRKRERALGKVEVVEAIARLSDSAEIQFGTGNYCFVLEELNDFNLKRENRVKQIAAIRDALVNQLRKKGYKYESRSGKVDGLRFVGAHYTSQVSPSGVWIGKDALEVADRPIGRRIGARTPKAPLGSVLRIGELKRQEGARWPRLFLDGSFVPAEGEALFWDDQTEDVQGLPTPGGPVWDADFIGALNIALRPVVMEGRKKGQCKATQLAEGHCTVNPTFRLQCALVVGVWSVPGEELIRQFVDFSKSPPVPLPTV